MALIKCPECSKEISDRAASCPHCGCPLDITSTTTQNIAPVPETIQSQEPVKKKKNGCLICFVIFCMIGMVGAAIRISLGPSTDSPTPAAITESKTAETLTKEEAQAIDSAIWDYIYPVINAHNQIMDAMTGYSEGTVSELDLYNAIKDYNDNLPKIWASPPSVSDENGKKYLESCRDYIIIEQTLAKSLLKYIDSKKTSDLSSVEKNIEQSNQAVRIVASNRGTFLGINNFTDEEIKKIAEESML